MSRSEIDRYTEPAARALMAARREAFCAEAPSIGARHVLAGLLAERDASLLDLLRRVGVPITGVEALLPARPAPPERPAWTRTIPFSDETRAILSGAVQSADAFGHARVGTAHLLLALLGEPARSTKDLLASCGLGLATVERELRATG